MPIASAWAGWIGAVLLVAGPEAPVSWSPDGQWLLYALVTPPIEQVFEPGWLYRIEPGSNPRLSAVAREPQLWATHLETKTSVLLSSNQVISSAAWRPDGTAVAYGRIVPDSGGGDESDLLFQVVVQEDLERTRVLFERKLAQEQRQVIIDWEGSRTAWSPDGAQLAVMDPVTASLLLLRAENGKLLRAVEGASEPSWSPDGKSVAFYRSGTSPGLYLVDENFGEPRLLRALTRVEGMPAPIWEQDGRAVMVVVIGSRLATSRRSRGVSVDLLKVELGGGEEEAVMPLAHPPLGPPEELESLSIAFDRQVDNVVHVSNVLGRVSDLVWTEVKRGETRKRFYPLDPGFKLGGLALSPVELKVGLRVGGTGVEAAVAVVDLDSGELVPVVPDEAARFRWLALLADGVRETLAAADEGAEADLVAQASSARLSLLPATAELNRESDTRPARLARLSRTGRLVSEMEVERGELSQESQRRLIEARLLYQYLKQDLEGEGFREARVQLERLEETAEDLVERDRLACLRIQVDQATGDVDRAGATIRYLQANRLFPSQVVEETSQGPVVREEQSRVGKWLDFLSKTNGSATASAMPAGAIRQVPVPPEPGIMGERVEPGPRVDTVVIEVPPEVDQVERRIERFPVAPKAP